MINYFAYIIVALILIFVIYLTTKAVGRGLHAKNTNKNLKKKRRPNKSIK